MTSVLVANRGEIARRITRTAHAMGLRSVAVYVDSDAEAPFVRDADHAVRLSGSYLDHDSVLAAAADSGADAIHPGYGFLSENADFAAAVTAAGLAWVGPSPEVIATMGDKLAAKQAAQAADVPVLASSEETTDGTDLSYPVLVKAAAGGGGKGMRIVDGARDLDEAVAAARREAAASFGDERVFLERYLPRARHVEIQILGDGHGHLVHLGERECSIQRRHQKIIEESPSPGVDDALREAMSDAALRLAGSIGYQSAGTVEFLVDADTAEFYFLEVNTRLQVEHAVTEEVTGIDLVREQLRVAGGAELGFAQADIAFSGHAIEARLYAEDPVAGFLPATGTVAAFAPGPAPVLRWEAGIAPGTKVGVEFDPLLAKAIAHAPTRHEAATRLALGLEGLHLGGVVTNRDFLASTLRSPEFLAGDTTTDFIERVEPPRGLAFGDGELDRTAARAALWLQGANRAAAPVLAGLPTGWRNARLPPERVTFVHGSQDLPVSYRATRDGTFRIDGGSVARVHHWAPDRIDAEIDGYRSEVAVTRVDDTIHIQTGRGTVALTVAPRFPASAVEDPGGGLVAPMPGIVLDLRVTEGETVAADQTLIVLEAMKMEHPMDAPTDGTVAEIHVAEGDQVENGAVLLVIDPVEDGS